MYIQRSAYWPSAGRFPHAFNRFFDVDSRTQSDTARDAWTPRVDVREEDKRFVITADIPGVDPKSIDINMEDGVLSIRGERKSGDQVEGARYTRVERARGAFQRQFALPDSADAEGIRASGKHGVLEIEIPKRPETTARKIDVEVEQ